MLDVTVANFETEVIEASKTVPVLVDFWAAWCGPCQSLGPLLEKLEVDYAGRFKLVKINADDEQQLAGAFGIRSLPTCVLMIDGKPVDGFMGAQPEGQIKALLDKHLPAGAPEEAPSEPEAPAAPDLNAPGALEQMADAVAANPDNHDMRYDFVKVLVQGGMLAEAKAAFEPVRLLAEVDQRFSALAWWISALEGAATADEAALQAAIQAKPRDFEARYALASLRVAQGRYTDGMDELLEILMRDKSWQDEAARKGFVAILQVITPPTPKVEDGKVPPEDPTVVKYRRRLSSVVLS